MANYLNNADLLREIITYQTASDDLQIEITTKSGKTKLVNARKHSFNMVYEYIDLMARNIATKYFRLDQAWKEDMISFARDRVILQIGKFDPSQSTNAFSYYTTCIKTEFKHFNKSENEHKAKFLNMDIIDALGSKKVVE